MTQLRQYRKLADEAERLGVSAATLRNWARSGKITLYRHERTTRVDPAELDNLLAQGGATA